MEIIKKFLTSLRLKGTCSVGPLDSNHVLIRPYSRRGLHMDFCEMYLVHSKFPVAGVQVDYEI